MIYLVQQRLPSQLDPPIGFAHRGARAHAPENTIEAFTLARKLGATGLESDVWLTAEGVPVLDHDGVVRGRIRKRPIAETPRAELPAHIPTLADLFALCDGTVHVSLDLKDPRSAPAVLAVTREVAPDLLPRLWLCEEDLDAAAALRRLDPDVRVVHSTRLARMREGPERRAHTLSQLGIDAVNLHHTDWTGGLTTLFHRFGRLAFSWDLQHDHLLRTNLRMGMDAVYSDWVDRMADAFAAEVGRTP
jgi:glycerophosphoryl diester phosphodiesterase